MVTFESLISQEKKIAVVGLGYAGLPLAIHLAAHFDVVGFDLKTDRIKELVAGIDRTLEVSGDQLKQAHLRYTDTPEDFAECRLIIVAVPTPMNELAKIFDIIGIDPHEVLEAARKSGVTCWRL
jgi:UDP-N-acetyl-D-galactosamine dehydrogenase